MQNQRNGFAAETVSTTNGNTQIQNQHQETGNLQRPHRQQLQHQGQEQEDAQASRQFVGALFAVLQQPRLPSTCLQQVGWLLSQLLANAQAASSQLLLANKMQFEQVRTCITDMADNSDSIERLVCHEQNSTHVAEFMKEA